MANKQVETNLLILNEIIEQDALVKAGGLINTEGATNDMTDDPANGNINLTSRRGSQAIERL
jgi:hypothetical protein